MAGRYSCCWLVCVLNAASTTLFQLVPLGAQLNFHRAYGCMLIWTVKDEKSCSALTRWAARFFCCWFALALTPARYSCCWLVCVLNATRMVLKFMKCWPTTDNFFSICNSGPRIDLAFSTSKVLVSGSRVSFFRQLTRCFWSCSLLPLTGKIVRKPQILEKNCARTLKKFWKYGRGLWKICPRAL